MILSHKIIRLLEQPSIPYEMALGIKPIISQCCKYVYDLEPSIKTIIDVGANKGEFSKAGRYYFPNAEIIAFEPIIEHRDLILKYADKVWSYGLSDQQGVFPFFYNPKNDASSSFLEPIKYKGKKEMISTVRFDFLFTKFKPKQKPVYLKIDAEGYEIKILRGFGELLKQIDFVQVEVIHQENFKSQSRFSEIVLLLESYDFFYFKQLNLTSNFEHSDLIFWK